MVVQVEVLNPEFAKYCATNLSSRFV